MTTVTLTLTRRARRLALAGLVLAVTVALASCGSGGGGSAAADPKPPDAANLRTITVSGTGTASVVPDLVELRVTIHVEGPTAAAALDGNSGSAGAVLAAAKAAGVADGDIQTANVSASPVFKGNPPKPAGYGADHSITFRLHDVAAAGGITDAIVAAGGPDLRLDGLQVTEDDPAKGLDDARNAAIADAKAKATAMASAAGTSVGSVRTISEASAGQPFDSTRSAYGLDAAGAAPVPIAPGTDRPTVQVTVVFDLA